VAVDERDLPRLVDLRRRAEANQVPGLEEVGPDRMREIEPHVAGIRGLWSPSTGIIDFRRVALSLADEVRARGGSIETSWPVGGIDAIGGEVVVRRIDGDARIASVAVECGGLHADRLARLAGEGAEPRIVPFRGDYYTLSTAARGLVRGLIYPVPDPRFPFLGIHFTRRVDGEVWAGPNAVLAFSREGYRRRDVRPSDLLETVRYRGFQRLAGRYLRTGLLELWRDWWKPAFVAELQRYVPAIRASDLRFGPSGIRAQALSIDGDLVDDFVLAGPGRVIHVRNAPSPAATSALAIGRRVASMALDRLAG
jgi:L-2-hydroxyglutarate oxidase LhgO